jgi:hypothetical protein
MSTGQFLLAMGLNFIPGGMPSTGRRAIDNVTACWPARVGGPL